VAKAGVSRSARKKANTISKTKNKQTKILPPKKILASSFNVFP
jgi:hypothetical protein